MKQEVERHKNVDGHVFVEKNRIQKIYTFYVDEGNPG